MISILLNLITVSLVLAAAFLSIHLFVLVRSQKRQRKLVHLGYRGRSAPLRQAGSPLLKNELVTLLNGDKRTAERLINQLCAEYPRQSVDWCIEKAIYDLERDRCL